jgi:uncharacterized protein (TIGR00255 family)
MPSINSMTGFGRIEVELSGFQLQWEIRSVNHRYLDVQFKLPDGFRAIEQELRQIVAAGARRGKVDASLSINRTSGLAGATKLNSTVSRQVIDHLETLAKEMKNPAAISPVAVLRWPGVLSEEEIDPETLFPQATECLPTAVAALCDSRAREGVKIQAMLEQRCIEIDSLVDEIRKRLPDVLIEIRQRLQKRVEALNVQMDNDRLEQEIVILAQKLDVSEELDRLNAHIHEIRSTFTSDEPVGRRLDFLIQELNREANTLGSKSADTETTQHAVDLKVLIEQMREQVQNVE